MDFSSIEVWLTDNLGDSALIVKMFVVVFITMLANFIWRRVYNRLHRQLEKTRNHWDDALLVSSSLPVVVMIWAIGAWVIINYLFSYPVREVVSDVVLVALFAWFLVRFISETEKNLARANREKKDESKVDQSTIEAISKLLRVSVSITTVLVILQTMGVSISAVLAFGGIGGIAVGFAAKDLLANFFGGLMIYLDRPFSVGDWIRSPDRNIEGTVEYIGWRQTRIRTFDKRPLYVPNAIFNSISVENPSRMKNRRIYETIGLRYDDLPLVARIIAEVKAMLQKHQDIDSQQTLIVNFNKFSESSLDFFVYTFTRTTDWVEFHQVKQAILLQIVEIIEKNGAEIAYPTQRIQIDSNEVNSN